MNRRGEAGVNNTVRWIGAIGLLVAASLALWKIMSKVMG